MGARALRAGARAQGRLSRSHLRIPGITYAVVAVLVLVKTRSLQNAALAVLGPFAGGVARGWQGDSARLSLKLAPWGVLFLAAGLLVQLLVPPASAPRILLRKAVWALATAGWFTLAIVSYLHAPE